jgi:hypothetical protein
VIRISATGGLVHAATVPANSAADGLEDLLDAPLVKRVISGLVMRVTDRARRVEASRFFAPKRLDERMKDFE